MKFSILGSDGYIGSALASALMASGRSVEVFGRAHFDKLLKAPLANNLGHVIYCIGLTADFRTRKAATVDAHVCSLQRLIENCDYESVTYLSSTRVYSGAMVTEESSQLRLESSSLDSLYNLSKLLGESICLQASQQNKVVRLSNVYGFGMSPANFLMSVLTEGVNTGRVIFRTSSDSTKDFVHLSDIVKWIVQIAERGDWGIYNLASGINVSNGRLAELLQRNGIETEFQPNAQNWSFSPINVAKVSHEFGPPTTFLESEIGKLITEIRANNEKHGSGSAV